MTSRRRLALILVAVALLGATVVGGYLLGASKAADEQDAAIQRQDAARPAFAAARAGAFARGVNHGLEAGTIAGRRQGRREGSRRGVAKGQVAAKAAFDEVALARAGRPESEVGAGGGYGYGGSAGSGGVLVVGDSLEVLTSPYLKRYLPSARLTINAVGGYSSLQIFELFKESYDPSQSVIVFDSGTNDNPAYPEILASRLKAVSDLVGDRCMVVPTIHGLSVNGITSAGKNRVVRTFAASRPATETPDWAGFVSTHPELMQSDNLHPIAEGADARAQLIAQAVYACQTSSPEFGARSGPGSD